MKNKLILLLQVMSLTSFAQETIDLDNDSKVMNIVDRFDLITGGDVNYSDSISILTAKLAELSLINDKLLRDNKSITDTLQEFKKSLYIADRNFLVEKYGRDDLKSDYSPEQYTDFKQNYFLKEFLTNKNETVVFFPFNKAAVNLKMYQEIDSLVALYLTEKKTTFRISAYSDSKGVEERNSELSKERAEFIKNYLVKEKKVNSKDIQTEGKGSKSKERFIETELDFLNRRAVITLN